MARSYKRHPSGGTGIYKGSKRRANRRVRQLLKNSDLNFTYSNYKRAYCQWEICEYREYAPSYQAFIRHARKHWWDKKRPCTEKNIKDVYDRWYRRK